MLVTVREFSNTHTFIGYWTIRRVTTRLRAEACEFGAMCLVGNRVLIDPDRMVEFFKSGKARRL